MDSYVTGEMIKKLREKQNMTQSVLADQLGVSDKTISKWETGRGLPDVSLLEPIARAFNISVIELMAGKRIVNQNRNFNMRKAKIYVCPMCGNIIHSFGEAVISCCGICLQSCEIEENDESHLCTIQKVEDEYFVSIDHEMTKEHYISFIAGIKEDGMELVKCYPEGSAQARFKMSKTRKILYYCNRHGLYEKKP